MSRLKVANIRQYKGSSRLAKSYLHTPLMEAFYGKTCGVPDIRSDIIFPTIPNNANNNLNSGSSVNSSRPSFSSQMEITFEELNKTRRVIEEHHLQSGLAITSLQTDNALNGQAIAELQGNTGRIIKIEAMLETLIAHIARDPSSTTQL